MSYFQAVHELPCLSFCCVVLFLRLHTSNTMYEYNYEYTHIHLSGVSEWPVEVRHNFRCLPCCKLLIITVVLIFCHVFLMSPMLRIVFFFYLLLVPFHFLSVGFSWLASFLCCNSEESCLDQ